MTEIIKIDLNELQYTQVFGGTDAKTRDGKNIVKF